MRSGPSSCGGQGGAGIGPPPPYMGLKQNLCLSKRDWPFRQQLPKVCCYFSDGFFPQMKIRRKWADLKNSYKEGQR